jgi:hypothetical protein
MEACNKQILSLLRQLLFTRRHTVKHYGAACPHNMRQWDWLL